ncbi:DUF4386 domain-containing protein [Pseudoroseicyclus sp. H15]
MTDLFNRPTSPAFGRLTGALYLSIAVFGAFAIGYVPSQIVQPDIGATLETILARRGLFTLGLGADALVMLIEVITTTMLFVLFRHVSPVLAGAAAIARLMMVGVMATMLFFQAGLLMIAETGGAPATAEVLLHMHRAGVWIWQLFFWLHLMILGQLVARSGLLPRLLGHAMTVGSFGYLLDSLYSFAFPDWALLGQVRVGFLVIVTLAEVSFALWLTIRGTRPAAPEARAAFA